MMRMVNHWKDTSSKFLTKAIVFNLYLFALGLFTSKALTSISGGLICLLGLIKFAFFRENPFKTINNWTLNLPILFFSFALFLSTIGHSNSNAFSEIQKHITIFILFFITTFNLHDLKQVKKIILFSIISMFIAASYGFYQHYILDYPIVSGFATHLGFGCMLSIFIIFTLVYGFWGKLNLSYRIALLTGAIFLGANLIFTQCRGAWLALLGGLFFLSWLKNKKLIIFIAIFCFILLSLLPQVYLDRFKSSFDLKQNMSNLGRIALWKGALLMYRDHFIKGVGIGQFSDEYKTNYLQPFTNTTCHAHNNILQFMAETGTLGLIGFIWLMAAIIIWLYKNYLQITDHNQRLFLLASLCGVITFNIQGLTEVNYGDAETLRLFWFLIALNVAIVKLSKDEPSQSHQQLSAG